MTNDKLKEIRFYCTNLEFHTQELSFTYYKICPIILFCLSTQDMEKENWMSQTNQIIRKFEQYGILKKLQVVLFVNSSDSKPKSSINKLIELCHSHSIRLIQINDEFPKSKALNQLINFITLRLDQVFYQSRLVDPAKASGCINNRVRVSKKGKDNNIKLLPQLHRKRKCFEY